jgi:hypothetical protein
VGGARQHAARGRTGNKGFHEQGTLTKEQAATYERLQWLELQLGRVPQILEWAELHRFAEHALQDGPLDEDGLRQFDSALGVLFLRIDFAQLAAYAGLPDVLERLGLYLSKSALLHVLGHPHEIPEEIVHAEGGGLDDFFTTWRDQPVAADLQPATAGEGATAVITSNVLGCRVTVTYEMREPAVTLAESILAAFESLASTFLGAEVFAHEPAMSVYVRVTELADFPWSFRYVEERGRPTFHVACREFSPHSLSPNDQVSVKTPLRDLVVAMFSRIAILRDGEILEPLIGDDSALQRAVDFAPSFVVVGNVLGTAPKTTVAQWMAQDDQTYTPLRAVPWDSALPATALEPAPSNAAAAHGDIVEEEDRVPTTPSRMPRTSRHSDVRTMSLIRVPLWNRARWRGVFYLSVEGAPPLMCLMFERPDAAHDILLGLEEDLGGTDDLNDALRVTILRGIDAVHPAWYRVVIGQSLPDAAESGRAPVLSLMMSRINQMEPETSENLEHFLAAYDAAGSYHFSAGMAGKRGEPRVAPIVFHKRRLVVRDAWTVGLNDPDVVGVRVDDNVVVPGDVADPPIRALQAWLAARTSTDAEGA